MLVLTRKNNESLFVGPDVRITVVRIAPDKVRLGVTAPAWVNVWREELNPITPEGQPAPAAAPLPLERDEKLLRAR